MAEVQKVRRVVLVDTTLRLEKGSMSLYCEMIAAAVAGSAGGRGLEIEVLHLGLRRRLWLVVPTRLRLWLNHLWMMATIRRKAAGCRADVVHIADGSHAYLAGRLGDGPVVITIHDVIPLLQDRGLLGFRRPGRMARWLIERNLEELRKADSIVADSDNTARDVKRYAGKEFREVRVIHPAVPPIVDAAAGRTVSGWEERRDRRDAFMLHVGNNSFYKNRTGVLRVFARVRSNCPVRLRMAGPAPTKEMRSLTNNLGLGDDVEFIVDPLRSELVRLYENACLLLFPSLYEGFGWPPLEAMALGCPVVCSSAGSLSEVVGGAALTCSPEEEDRMASLCLDVLGDPELAERLVRLGLARCKEFTLENMGKELAEVYDRVGQARARRANAGG